MAADEERIGSTRIMTRLHPDVGDGRLGSTSTERAAAGLVEHEGGDAPGHAVVAATEAVSLPLRGGDPDLGAVRDAEAGRSRPG